MSFLARRQAVLAQERQERELRHGDVRRRLRWARAPITASQIAAHLEWPGELPSRTSATVTVLEELRQLGEVEPLGDGMWALVSRPSASVERTVVVTAEAPSATLLPAEPPIQESFAGAFVPSARHGQRPGRLDLAAKIEEIVTQRPGIKLRELAAEVAEAGFPVKAYHVRTACQLLQRHGRLTCRGYAKKAGWWLPGAAPEVQQPRQAQSKAPGKPPRRLPQLPFPDRRPPEAGEPGPSAEDSPDTPGMGDSEEIWRRWLDRLRVPQAPEGEGDGWRRGWAEARRSE